MSMLRITHSSKFVNEGHKIPCTTHGCGHYRAIYVRIHNFQKLCRSPPPLVWKCNYILFAFDAHFAKQWGCGTRIFFKVQITEHVLEYMNTLYVQMAKAMVPKLERTISHWRLHQIGRFHCMCLRKIHCVQVAFVLRNRNGFTIIKFECAFN